MISIPKSELPIYKRGPMTMEEIKARRAEIEKLKLSEENNSPAMTSQGGADGEGGVAKEPEEDKSEHVFIAVGRVFSGTIRKGDSLKALRMVFIARRFVRRISFLHSKVGCAFPMVIVAILPHAEFGPNDHREAAPLFTISLVKTI